MKKTDDNCGYYGMTLGEIVAADFKKTAEEIARLQKNLQSRGFHILGEMIQDFMSGNISFKSIGKVKVTGEPANLLERCCKGNVSIADLNLQDKPLDEVMLACRDTIADLTYLILKGAVVAEPVGYERPGFTAIESIIDMKKILEIYPEFKDYPGIMEMAKARVAAIPFFAIAAVDLVVLVIDAIRFKKA